jgi:hypothetical protein
MRRSYNSPLIKYRLGGAITGPDQSGAQPAKHPDSLANRLLKSGLGTTTSSLRGLLNWNVEDFVLHLAGDAGVAFNHRPQSLLLNERERSGVQV